MRAISSSRLVGGPVSPTTAGRPARKMPAFDRDRLAGVAEILLVVEIDGGDDGDIGIDQVDRIEAPTQTDLEHGHVEGRLREPLECRQCREFEKGQRDIAAHCIDAPESVDDGLVTASTPSTTMRSLKRNRCGDV